MENFEDDDIIINDEKTLSAGMNEFLADRFGTPEESKQSNPSGFDNWLADKFPPIPGPIQEKSVAEQFAELKKRRY